MLLALAALVAMPSPGQTCPASYVNSLGAKVTTTGVNAKARSVVDAYLTASGLERSSRAGIAAIPYIAGLSLTDGRIYEYERGRAFKGAMGCGKRAAKRSAGNGKGYIVIIPTNNTTAKWASADRRADCTAGPKLRYGASSVTMKAARGLARLRVGKTQVSKVRWAILHPQKRRVVVAGKGGVRTFKSAANVGLLAAQAVVLVIENKTSLEQLRQTLQAQLR